MPPRPAQCEKTLSLLQSYSGDARAGDYDDCGACPCADCAQLAAAASAASARGGGKEAAAHVRARAAMPLQRLRAEAEAAVHASLAANNSESTVNTTEANQSLAAPSEPEAAPEARFARGWLPASLPASAAGAFELELTRALLRWFKNEHFTWVNALPCVNCGGKDTVSQGVEQPNAWEQTKGASRTELYACPRCPGTCRRQASNKLS